MGKDGFSFEAICIIIQYIVWHYKFYTCQMSWANEYNKAGGSDELQTTN